MCQMFHAAADGVHCVKHFILSGKASADAKSDKYRWTVTDWALEAAAMRDKDTADVFTSYAATLPHRNS